MTVTVTFTSASAKHLEHIAEALSCLACPGIAINVPSATWPVDRPLTPQQVAYLAHCAHAHVYTALDNGSLIGTRAGAVDGIKSPWSVLLADAENWISRRATTYHQNKRRTMEELLRRFPNT
jgi:hypothetical protein